MNATARAARGFEALCAAIVDLSRRRAWFVLATAVAAAVVLGVVTANNLRFNTDSSGMLSEELPFRKNYLAYKTAFASLADTLIVVVDGGNADLVDDAADRLTQRLTARTDVITEVFDPAGHPFFRRNGFLFLDAAKLSDLSDRLADAQPLLTTLARDPSLRGLFEVLGLAVDDLAKGGTAAERLEPALNAVADVLEGKAQAVSWRALMFGGDAQGPPRRIIITRPRLDYSSFKPAAAAMSAVRAAAAELGLDAAHGVRVRLTGSAALDAEELESVEQGASMASLASFLLVLALLTIGLRSWRQTLALAITLVLGLVLTAGFATVGVGQLNMISVAFAVLFIGLAVDLGIYFALRYREEMGHLHDRAASLRGAARGVGGALTLSVIASAVAFFSFLLTPYRGVAELGLIAGVGMFIALALTLTVLPALHRLLPPADRSGDAAVSPLRTGIAWIHRHRRAICVAAAALALASLPLATQVRFSYDPLDLKDPSRESVRTIRDLSSDADTSRYTITVLQPNLAAADALAARLKALPSVGKAVTASDYVPKDQDEKLALIDQMAIFLNPILDDDARMPPDDSARHAALAGFRDKVASLIAGGYRGPLAAPLQRVGRAIDRALGTDADTAELERRLVGTLPARLASLRDALEAKPVKLADLPTELRRRMLADDGRARIEVYPKDVVIGNETALRRFVDEVKSLAPNATDAPVVILEAADAVSGAFLEASAISLVAITLLLLVVLRSMLDVAMVMLPIVLSSLVTIGILVATGMTLNFANVIVLPLLIGISIESGIQLVSRARHLGADAALRTSTPRGVLFSGLNTIASFGTLAISPHQGTASLGMLLTIAIAAKLVCALVVLPAVLAWIPRYAQPPRRPDGG